MKRCLVALILPLCLPMTTRAADNRLFEMRTYFAAPGKLDSLLARFRNHTLKLFAKHGMTNIGYWTPVDNSENKLVYMLAFKDRQARDKAFAEFGADPEWQQAAKESEKDGKLVDKIESVFMKPTDFSPKVKPKASSTSRLYELRIYTAAPDKLAELHARFKNHTLALFRKHGMASFGYWTPVDPRQGADNTLVYMISHKDKESASKSWREFQNDPKWIVAKTASEANGPLLSEPPKSVYLSPTDFSPAK